MKRFLLSVALFATTLVTVSAQSELKSNSARVDLQPTMPTVAVPTVYSVTSKDIAANMKVRKVQKADDVLSALYDVPSEALYPSLDLSTGYGSFYFCVPSYKDVTYYNYTQNRTDATTYTWTCGSESLTYTLDGINGVTKGWGSAYVPTLTATDNGKTSSYQLTYETSSGASRTYIMSLGREEKDTVSNANIWNGMYKGFSDMPKTFSTNATFSNLQNGAWATAGTAVGFAETYTGIDADTYAEGIYLLCSADGLDASSPLEGKTLTATICTIEDDGSLTTYATATASDADVVTSTALSGCYSINFKFKEEDPIFGSVDTNISLPTKDFIVVLTGFSELSHSFTALFNSADGWAGNGYAVLSDGSFATVGYSNYASLPQVNLFIGFLGFAMPTAEPATDAYVKFDAAGGSGVVDYTGTDGSTTQYSDLVIYTVLENWKVSEKPDWVTPEINTEYLSNGTLDVTFTATALESGQTGRYGNIVLAGDFGKKVTITALQGDAITGINSVTVDDNSAAKANANIYNLNGQRVSKNAKGILIQNGKKFINK